ncbi:MAG: M20/M25/M40 family metallo-hydrolase [Clostridia bacterium]
MNDSEKARYSQTLSSMIKIATISNSDDKPTDNVKEFREYVKNRFPNIAKNCETIDKFDGGLMIKWSGADSAKSPLALMSHFDVVKAEGEWTHSPFGGEIADGKIYGRGAADTKGSLCAFLEACEKLIASGFTPDSDVYMLSSSREEIAGKDAKLMSEYFAKNGIKPALLIDEGGAVLDKPMSFINGQFAMIAMSERSGATLTLDGKKENIEKFSKRASKTKFAKNAFPSEVEEMFRRMTPKMMSPMKQIFKHIGALKGLLCFALPKVSREAGAMVAPSLTFKDEDGKKVCKVACTYYHGIENILEKFKALAEKFEVKATVSVLHIAPKPTDFNCGGMKLVEKTVVDVFENTAPTPFIIFGGTDARHFAGIADCVIRFAPLIMTNEIIGTVHKPNEYIFENSIWKAVEFYERLIKNFQNGI